MASGRGRAVRIPRRVPVSASPTPVDASPRPVESPGDSSFHENRAGLARARRLFLILASGLLLFFVGFVSLVAASTAPGARTDASVYVFLGVVPLAFGGLGWWLTLGRTPYGARCEAGSLILSEPFGRFRSFPLPVSIQTVQRFSPGPLSPAATEIAQVGGRQGPRRTYLVADGFFGFIPPPPIP